MVTMASYSLSALVYPCTSRGTIVRQTYFFFERLQFCSVARPVVQCRRSRWRSLLSKSEMIGNQCRTRLEPGVRIGGVLVFLVVSYDVLENQIGRAWCR